MERRYLVAALAIVATFTGFSHGFRSLQHASLVHAKRWGDVAKAKCEAFPAPAAAARAMATLRTRLRPAYPEEAQLLAEMNVPIASMEAQMAEQMARQNAAAECARAKAMREALRASRQAMKMREKMMRFNTDVSMAPISLEMNFPDDFGQRMEARTAAIAARVAARNVRLQIAADKLHDASMRLADSDWSTIESNVADQVSAQVVTHVRCKVNSK